MRGLSKLIAAKRLCYLKREASFKFTGVVHNCCNVSANNHDLAFVIRRSVLGYPMVEQIARPRNVSLSETDNCVIVKDGYVYELTRRVE
jgi:hypothetical protein